MLVSVVCPLENENVLFLNAFKEIKESPNPALARQLVFGINIPTRYSRYPRFSSAEHCFSMVAPKRAAVSGRSFDTMGFSR